MKERKIFTGQIIQETPYLIGLLNRRSCLPKLRVCDNRELWDNGEGGQTNSSLSSSPGTEPAIDSDSESAESSWMNSLNEETPLFLSEVQNKRVRLQNSEIVQWYYQLIKQKKKPYLIYTPSFLIYTPSFFSDLNALILVYRGSIY